MQPFFVSLFPCQLSHSQIILVKAMGKVMTFYTTMPTSKLFDQVLIFVNITAMCLFKRTIVHSVFIGTTHVALQFLVAIVAVQLASIQTLELFQHRL